MINAEVKVILETLRDLRLDWIADEIEETVRAGKTVEKEYVELGGRSKKRASATAPYEEAEEEQICLITLATYFIDLSELWEKTKSSFSELLQANGRSGSPSLEIVNEEGQAIVPFESQYFQQRDHLSELLTRAKRAL
jgi:hypothetical protein